MSAVRKFYKELERFKKVVTRGKEAIRELESQKDTNKKVIENLQVENILIEEQIEKIERIVKHFENFVF
jgi:predicted  nucleic acid-binding Zn-ribbon protein